MSKYPLYHETQAASGSTRIKRKQCDQMTKLIVNLDTIGRNEGTVV